MVSKNVSPKSLMEAIALLYMINQCPESSKDNQLPQKFTNLSASYQLPLQREKEIVDNLAFLSATKNDSTRVMAVCLEEAVNGNSCTIRLASNTGDLHEIVNGFNGLARILERAASRVDSRDDDTKALYRCIVALDYFRILTRLRSRHAKKNYRKKDQPILMTSLDTAIHDRSIQPSSNITTLELKNIRTKVTALKAVFQRFEDIPNHSAESVEVQDVIMDLIIQMYELGSQTKFKSALESSSTLESGVKEFLPVAIGKIGRYYSISYELVCAARNKEYSIFNNIRIRISPVRPPSQPSNIDSSIHPLTAIQNVFRPKTAAELRALQQSLESNLKKTTQDISDDLRVIIMDYYQYVKVHAEIQLLFFYEQNPRKPRPRMICSSKSACYLCDLFFRIHGRFFLPRTHGRLYHKWTLPDWHTMVPEMRRFDFNVILIQFRDALKVRIRTALKSGPGRIRHPNESVLVMPAHWSSSMITEVKPSMSEAKIARRSPAQTPKGLLEVSDSIESKIPGSTGLTNQGSLLSEPSPQAELLNTAASSLSHSISTLHLPAHETVTHCDKISTSHTFIPPDPEPLHDVSSNSSSSATLRPYYDLKQGETTWQPISGPNTSINIGTSRLRLQLSYDSGDCPTSSKKIDNSSSCWVQVRWIPSTEWEIFRAETQVVDVDDLADVTEVTLEHGAAFSCTELYLRRGEHVLLIKYAFERKTEMKKTAIGEVNE